VDAQVASARHPLGDISRTPVDTLVLISEESLGKLGEASAHVGSTVRVLPCQVNVLGHISLDIVQAPSGAAVLGDFNAHVMTGSVWVPLACPAGEALLALDELPVALDQSLRVNSDLLSG